MGEVQVNARVRLSSDSILDVSALGALQFEAVSSSKGNRYLHTASFMSMMKTSSVPVHADSR